MGRTGNELGGWSTGQLIEEILARCAADGGALRLLGGRVLDARLSELDNRSDGLPVFSYGEQNHGIPGR